MKLLKSLILTMFCGGLGISCAGADTSIPGAMLEPRNSLIPASSPVPGPMPEDQQLPSPSDLKQRPPDTNVLPADTQRAEQERVLADLNRKLQRTDLSPQERLSFELERQHVEKSLQSQDVH